MIGAQDSTAQAPAPRFRRRVFYVPGYDPIHPRRYRELYRKEGADQARLSGYDLSLAPKTTEGPYGWRVQGQMDGTSVQSDIEVLVWADIVRDSMSNSIPATYLQLLRTAWVYIGSGALFGLMRLRKGPVIAALYPIIFLLGQLGLACAVGWAVGAASVALSGSPLAGALGLVPIPFILRWFKRHDNKVFAYYLMHDYAFAARTHGAIPPALHRRMAQFTTSIRAAMDGPYDEVLVVGHSSGAHLGVSILADLLRAGLPDRGPALGFLSLGQVVPMVSFLKRAGRLRGDLAYLSAHERVTWVDVTAPGDGCAFALCDPVAVSGVAPQGQKGPLILSAAFSQTLSPPRWKALRWKFFRLHFQYLCAFDALPGRADDYDYFRITAGPKTLGQRFSTRPASKSRLTKPVNRFTSVT